VPTSPAADFESILRALSLRHVDFIVVGGVCAVLHGAPVQTFDLDLVHSREPDNLKRLVPALRELKARYRTHPRQRIEPSEADLASPGAHLLVTSLGPLDLMGRIAPGQGYADLLPKTIDVDAGGKLRLKLLTLEALIEAKEAAARAKDRAMLPVLRQTLKERR
jgi:hypothetical protein